MTNFQIGILFFLFGFICLISLCCVSYLLINDNQPQSPTTTPQPQIPIEQIIAMTADAARMQTQVLYTPTLYPPIILETPTFTPAVIVLPTATIFIFQLQTNVAQPTIVQPTEFIYYTNTPFVLSTQPNSNGGNCNSSYPTVCINDNPRLNCTELEAKGISKFKVLPPDPLGYDKDNDGIGCE